MAIKVDLVADASRAIKEAGNLGDALGNVADDLGDVGDQGKTIDDKVADAFRNLGDDAKKAGKDVGTHVKGGTDKAGEGLDELKSEGAGTAREVAASFGSVEDALGGIQEVAANAFAGFGPAGMAAGIVVAAGIGLAMSALEDNAAKINENKQKMLDYAKVFRGEGGEWSDSQFITEMENYGDSIQDTKEFYEVWQKDAVTGWDKIREATERAGVGNTKAFTGSFGPLKDAVKVREELQRQIEETTAAGTHESAMADETGQAYTYLDDAAQTRIQGLKDLLGTTDENIKKQEQAHEVERIRRQGIEGTTAALREDISALEARADAQKNGITSELDYLDGVDNLTAKLKENGNTVADNSAKGRDNQRAIIDQASAIEDMALKSIDAGGNVASVTAKFNAQKDALINQVTPAFGGSKEAARRYIEQILKTPGTIKTDVNLDGIPDAEQKLNNFTGKPRDVGVRVLPLTDGPTGTSLDKYINGMQGRAVYVDIKARNGGAIDA